MPQVAPAATKPSLAAPVTTKATTSPVLTDGNATVRLHITPFTPALLKSYFAPSVLPLTQNISYHHIETFPEKAFGYVELPAMEAQKLKKKLNGATLKGSKVKIETAKPEKRKAVSGDPEAIKEDEPQERPAKRAKKSKKREGVLEGVELPDDRKIKRGWTEPAGKNKKDKKDAKGLKTKQKDSKYTKEPEMLFKAKLTPVAATEAAHKEKKDKKDKKESKEEKKEKKKSRSKQEVVVHEFKKNKKEPSFLRSAKISMEKKPPVEYINGTGWVDEDGNVVEAETGKARNRRVLELVDFVPVQPTTEKKLSATPEPSPSPKPMSKTKHAQKAKTKKAATPSSESESESESDGEESSVVSSSSEDEASESSASSPAQITSAPQIGVTPSSPEDKKEVHPLEALFKRPKPPTLTSPTTVAPTSAPVRGLAPINTSFSFFENENNEPVDVDAEAGASENAPSTPGNQRDLEWRGLRSAAPTPDTAAIGRRFSFPWRKGSQEVDDDEDDDIEAGKQLSNNTKANASVSHLPGLVEEDEDEDNTSEKNEEDEESDEGASTGANEARFGPRTRSTSKRLEEGEEESEFGKWFWENRGENNRAWKKRRREALKTKRLRDNKKMATGGRAV